MKIDAKIKTNTITCSLSKDQKIQIKKKKLKRSVDHSLITMVNYVNIENCDYKPQLGANANIKIFKMSLYVANVLQLAC